MESGPKKGPSKPEEKKHATSSFMTSLTVSVTERKPLGYDPLIQKKITMERSISTSTAVALLQINRIEAKTNPDRLLQDTSGFRSTTVTMNDFSQAEIKSAYASAALPSVTGVKDYGTVSMFNVTEMDEAIHTADIQLTHVCATPDDMGVALSKLEDIIVEIGISNNHELRQKISGIAMIIDGIEEVLQAGNTARHDTHDTNGVSVSSIKIKTFFNNSLIEATKKSNEVGIQFNLDGSLLGAAVVLRAQR